MMGVGALNASVIYYEQDRRRYFAGEFKRNDK